MTLMKAVSIYSGDVDGALSAVASKWPFDYKDEKVTFEDFHHENQVEIITLLADEYADKNKLYEFKSLFFEAIEDGELVDYLLPVLKNRNNAETLKDFLHELELKLIHYHADELNERLEHIQQSFIEDTEYYRQYGTLDDRDDAA